MNESDRGDDPVEFSEEPEGREALDRWSRRYEELNGAPENEEDR